MLSCKFRLINIMVEELPSSSDDRFDILYAADIGGQVSRDASKLLDSDPYQFLHVSMLNPKNFSTELSFSFKCKTFWETSLASISIV